VAVFVIALPMLAATPSDFYLTMLRKGMAAHDAGRFDMAVSPLRVAAFGTVESVEHYQTAHVYLALSFDRLGNPDQARDSARRVVAAQRIDPRYGALTLPAPTRTAFDGLVKRLLTAADTSILAQRPGSQPVSTPANTTARPAVTATQPPQTSTNPQTQPVKNPPVQNPLQTPASTTPPAQTTTAPAQTTTAQPQPVKPQPAPTDSTPVPPRTSTTQASTNNKPPATTNAPANATPNTTTTAPKPAPAATKPAAKPPVNVPARFAAADRALGEARLLEAREIYREILDSGSLQRADLLRVAEGFYRSRDFSNALRAFERLGRLQSAEQPYRYYIAVAYYETGQYNRAKQELAAVLPYIEETADVTRYRTKIENAIN